MRAKRINEDIIKKWELEASERAKSEKWEELDGNRAELTDAIGDWFEEIFPTTLYNYLNARHYVAEFDVVRGEDADVDQMIDDIVEGYAMEIDFGEMGMDEAEVLGMVT